MLVFFEELFWAFIPLPLIFASLYVIKFILANLIALFVPSYQITVSPEKTSAQNLKTGQVASMDNVFYTAVVPAKKSGLQDVLISIGETGKSEHELQAELKQRYVQFKKNTLYNSEARIGGFWQIILNYFLLSEFNASTLTLLCGRHRIYFKGISAEQQPEIKKAIKLVLHNARFMASNGHGIST